ncbi:hypothetical protein D0T50_05145 [Bacteroides sp. 214]|uniref:hypothetical protein n=1 Tax=Bacteroides sp. 214 TaxID=2302935 RepID=UPI0013D155F5|nr:hypothetical protein [Bacteroides sp. 214]NDW12274.1 hypothetical protein [Bacteroides sp. 214]
MSKGGKKKEYRHPAVASKRQIRMTCLVSEEEQRAIDRYLEKYKITNKSRWVRETILKFILKNMEEDYPTLFEEHDMRR